MKKLNVSLSTPDCIKNLACSILEINSLNELDLITINDKNAIDKSYDKAFIDITEDWESYPQLLNNLSESGIAVGIVMNDNTFALRSSIQNVRKELIEKHLISSVISLTYKLFNDTGISITLMVFKRNNSSITFVDARDVYQPIDRTLNTLSKDCIQQIVSASNSTTNISCNVPYNEISTGYMLAPNYYINIEDIIKNCVTLESLTKNIICGLDIPAKELNDITSDTPTKYQYITPKNISSGKIQYTMTDEAIRYKIPYMKYIDDNYLNYKIPNNAVIITAMAGSPRCAIAKWSDDQTVIAVGNLYILELDETKVNPYYIKKYFESENGHKALSNCMIGMTVGNIKPDLLKKLHIPLISLEEQNKLI